MPSHSDKQRRFMAAAAHDPKFAKKAGIPVKVAKKYNPKNFGAWYDKGQIHIDPVKIVKSYAKAQRLGRQFNQQTIHSFTSGKTLNVLKRGR